MQIRFDPLRPGSKTRLVIAAITFTLAACGSGGSTESGVGSTEPGSAATGVGAKNLTAVSSGGANSTTKDQLAGTTPKAASTRTTTAPVNATAPTTTTAPVNATPTGRLLASNCFQCHGTNGVPSGGFDKLAGQGAREIANEMKEMASSGEKGVMHVMALGFTDEQAWQLATYFSTQR